MFTNRVFVSSVVFLLTTSAAVGRAHAEDAADFMAQALSKVAGSVLQISQKTNYGYDENVSLLGGCIRTGQSTEFIRELRAGESYVILGRGDRDALDVDLSLFGPDGQRVAADLDRDAEPFVEFRPWQTGRYTISLKVERGMAGESFCAMAILRRGGWNVPAQNLIDAATRCVGKCRDFAPLAKSLRFGNEPNQWSLFGGVLRQGESIGLTNIHLGHGQHLFVGAGDSHAQDIDSFLTLPFNGSIVAKDTAPDPVPTFGCQTQDRDVYEYRLKNERSDGASLMFAAALSQG
jgi:hypothetical protein